MTVSIQISGTIKQIDIIADVFDQFKTDNNQIIVDPAMADNGSCIQLL